MKNTLLVLSLIFLLLGCDKDEEAIVEKLPTTTTTEITNISGVKATSGGNVTDVGGTKVTKRGVCWSTSPNPTTSDYLLYNGVGTGHFVSSLKGLTENTTYYIRAYATNKIGTGYGKELSFSTAKGIPTLTTSTITEITTNTATSSGNILNDAGNNLTARGVCWSTSTNPTTSDFYNNNETGTKDFVSLLTDLTENTTYYIRAYATYDAETVYGNELSFKTKNSVYEGDITLTTQQEGVNFGNQGYSKITGKLQIGPSNFNDTSKSINNLNSLQNLTTIGGDLAIHTTFLTNLEGLHNISSIGGFLSVASNNNLTNLSGLNSLTSIGRFFSLTFNRSLINLEGLNNLSSISEGIEIYLNENLINFSGLNNLTSIGGNSRIDRNASLTNLNDLSSLSTINGDIYISENFNLENIDGLTSLSTINGNLTISYSGLDNLNGLTNLTTINGDLTISNNQVLTQLDGLSNLSTLNGNLTIDGNINLNDFCGIQLLINNGFSQPYTVSSNKYNPTKQDVINGNCSQ